MKTAREAAAYTKKNQAQKYNKELEDLIETIEKAIKDGKYFILIKDEDYGIKDEHITWLRELGYLFEYHDDFYSKISWYPNPNWT